MKYRFYARIQNGKKLEFIIESLYDFLLLRSFFVYLSFTRVCFFCVCSSFYTGVLRYSLASIVWMTRWKALAVLVDPLRLSLQGAFRAGALKSLFLFFCKAAALHALASNTWSEPPMWIMFGFRRIRAVFWFGGSSRTFRVTFLIFLSVAFEGNVFDFQTIYHLLTNRITIPISTKHFKGRHRRRTS